VSLCDPGTAALAISIFGEETGHSRALWQLEMLKWQPSAQQKISSKENNKVTVANTNSTGAKKVGHSMS